tara:strand:+ start:333 stop:641 length:309 start_codon:yes stop_codon:yes gene_type:complete
MNRFRDFLRKSTPEGKKYFNNILYPNIEISSDDLYIITREGDRLDNLALEMYKDKSLWWVILKANPNKVRRDSYYVQPGIELRLPSNIDSIKTRFRNLNKGR